jgi:hypothetical protein
MGGGRQSGGKRSMSTPARGGSRQRLSSRSDPLEKRKEGVPSRRDRPPRWSRLCALRRFVLTGVRRTGWLDGDALEDDSVIAAQVVVPPLLATVDAVSDNEKELPLVDLSTDVVELDREAESVPALRSVGGGMRGSRGVEGRSREVLLVEGGHL